MSRQIVVSNESSVVSAAEFIAAVNACRIQVERDFAPAYSGLRADLIAVNGKPPSGVEVVHIVDTSDVAGALGYHEYGSGHPEGFVFAKTTKDAGGNWQGTLSHELLEQILDPLASWTVQAGSGANTKWIALEACDPVEDDEYSINGVRVSNFVLPRWFAGPGGHADFLGRLKRGGLSLDAGGYIAYADSQGNWHQITAGAQRVRGGPFSRDARYAGHRRSMRTVNWQGVQGVLAAIFAGVAQIVAVAETGKMAREGARL